ncbi:cupin domain-containing protein [Paenibacillus spiritus]|uniref:Cupin domain-containing protein n=1 Tax=Paenibacillus spiritus TaxID=2496557 RepID=A0A5J5FXG0_9BACL|nr:MULTISPECIES: cupin domain-containing protein [Paenibacillus]KAA8998796.1 cupin domain-containing protein [Paenibacillus spiritus]
MEKASVTAAMEYKEERFTKRVLFQKGESVLFVLNFLPGQELPLHNHPGADVYITVLEGEGTVLADGAEYPAARGDAFHIGGGEQFAYRCGGGPSSLHVVLSKLPGPEYGQNV